MVKEFVRYKMEILGVCEHRWPDSGEKRLPTEDGKFLKFIYSGKPASEIRESGVGLILSESAARAMIDYSAVSDRILTARFRTKARTIVVIQCYAPTEQADPQIKEDFYELLSATLERQNKGNIVIMMGDMNAKVGSDNDNFEKIMGKHGVGTRNDNGSRLVELCSYYDLVIGGTLFNHRNCHKLTWFSNDGRTRNQIDHFTIDRKWRRSMLDVRVYRGADVGSDHQLVVSTIKLKLAAVKKSQIFRRKEIDPRKLQDTRTLRVFKEGVTESLRDFIPNSCEEHWGKIKDSYVTVAKRVLPHEPERRSCYITDATWSLINERKEINGKKNTAETQELYLKYQEAYSRVDDLIKTSARRDKRKWFHDIADKAQEAANQHQTRDLYQYTRRLAGRPKTLEKPVKSLDGTVLTDETLQIERWTQHFKSILNVQRDNQIQLFEEMVSNAAVKIPKPKTKISDKPPSINEIKDALSQLKSGKAPGPDQICVELFKADLNTAARELQPLIESIWDSGEMPDEMKEVHLIKLPKKGDLSLCDNWRGISLLNTIAKVISRIIQERIEKGIDPQLRPEQSGFRKRKSTTDQINTLRIIIEQCQELQASLFLLFVDFEKAFDSLNQEIMWKILELYGVPKKLIEIAQETYNGAKIKVVHKGAVGPGFEVKSGVKQGDIFSPTVFIIVLDFVLRHVNQKKRGIQWNPFTRLADLDYADDIVAMAHTMTEIKAFTDDLVKFASVVGLKVNVAKTKLMKINTQNTRATNQLTVEGVVVEEVENFKYLGSIVNKDGGAECDVKNRIQMAQAAFGMMQSVWRSKQLSESLKIRLFNSNVKSVLLSGCETWKVKKTLSSQLQVFINRCLRKICGIFYPDRISNEDLLQRTRQRQIAEEIGRRKWSWIGHTLRKPQEDLTRQALSWKPEGKKKSGGQRITWQKSVIAEANQQGYTWKQVEALATNRVRFRKYVDALHFG